MFATVALCFVFAALANAQMSVVVFPPAVNYVNSDFNQTMPGLPGPAYGHFDFIKGNNMHIIATSMGYTVEEWIVETSASVTAYILMQGQCQKQDIPVPDLGCTGWSQDASGNWKQMCKPDQGGDGQVTIVVKVVNGQPAWLDESADVNGQHVTTRITFATTSAQPPSTGTLTPPASCQTTAPVPRQSHLQKLVSF